MDADYIIVGGGSAGCVLAYRLSENPHHRVLLIEAGPDDASPFITMPRGFGRTLTDPALTWFFPTEPDTHHPDARGHVWVRGKTLGGSSSVNGMIYVRGQPEDYDGWAAHGANGWSWADLLPCFKAMENHELGADEVRGAGGPLHISIQRAHTPLTDAIIEAGVHCGLPRREDLNRPDQTGIGPTPATIWRGRRVSAASAFLRPARRRSNLRVVTGTLAHKIGFDGRRAVSVSCSSPRGPVTYRAAREIILCAGAIQSPALLQRSGLGPAAVLAAAGVPVLSDMPAVGANLREHKLFTLQYRLKQGWSDNSAFSGARLYANALRYYLTRSGPLARTYDVNAFAVTKPGLRRADVQLTFSAFSLDLSSQTIAFEPFPGMQVYGYPLRPESQGSLAIRSADPDEAPVIRPNYLSAPYDREVTIGMVRLMRKVMGTPPLDAFIAQETSPSPSVESDEAILAAAHKDQSCAHAVGTCRMGSDPGDVVDPALRVRGVSGLRVMDCSVMPTQVSGNTNGPVMAMAWRAADIILGEASN